MVPQDVVLFLALEVVLFLALERLKRGTKTNSPVAIYIYIYISGYGCFWCRKFSPFFHCSPSFIVKNRVLEMLLRCAIFFFGGGAHLKKNTYFCRNRLISKQKGVFLQKWAILGLFGEVSHTQTEISQKKFNIPRVSVLFPIKHD